MDGVKRKAHRPTYRSRRGTLRLGPPCAKVEIAFETLVFTASKLLGPPCPAAASGGAFFLAQGKSLGKILPRLSRRETVPSFQGWRPRTVLPSGGAFYLSAASFTSERSDRISLYIAQSFRLVTFS